MTAGDGVGFNCVIDASVGIKLFLIEPLSDRTDALFARLVDDPPSRFYVPDLFSIECTNTLWKYVRRFGYPADAAQQDVAHLTRLPLQVAKSSCSYPIYNILFHIFSTCSFVTSVV
jgi:predicted nucleic acid-binding protein